MGTKEEPSDFWVELYNPQACVLDLSGWKLKGTYFYYTTVFNISLSGQIPPNGYFVLADKTTVFQNVTVNQANTSLYFYSHYQALQLISPSGSQVDTANYSYSYNYPAGIAYSSNANQAYSSMERRGVLSDSPSAWITYAGTTSTIKDSGGHIVHGTPGRKNWAWGLIPTPSPTATKTKRPPTPRPPTLAPRMVLNEFLPRPGSDWNGDGQVNVYDEFIEVQNLGPGTINLSGWRLDNIPTSGGTSYTLPSMNLTTGQRAVFYGLTTHILLQDSGGTVRLLNRSGVVVDARGYGPVMNPDVSTCRIPDGIGYWRDDCFPTPGLENALTGAAPAPPPQVEAGPPPCLLPDDTPPEFVLAECSPYGQDIWNPALWDHAAGQSQYVAPDVLSNRETILR